MNNNKIKAIAFYLPQFHPIPENDKAYGEGFTEWTNTKKAKPLFDGHYQPRTPINKNYYSLLDEKVMIEQAKLAKEKGIFGFCYYHYWFSGCHKLLEKPIENMLKNPKIDIPFCLCWANENWTKRWDGGNNEVIAKQDYGDFDELDKHTDYLCEFFKDHRYIKIDNRPVLLLYRPELIQNLKEYIKRIRYRALVNGFNILLIVQHPDYYYLKNSDISIFDYYIQFQPFFGIRSACKNIKPNKIKRKLRFLLEKLHLVKLINIYKEKTRKLTHYNYDEIWNQILSYDITDSKLIAGAFVDWDNTPRNKLGIVFDETTPEKFGMYMRRLFKKVHEEYSQPFIFINAWNEWAEGAYLEPDDKYGYAYINALFNALKEDDSL